MSNSWVIKAENLGKQYRIGTMRQAYGTLRDSFTHWLQKFLKGNTDGERSEAETIWALKDVSFEVKQGEVLGVIGRNGAGKSTLLKILSRITAPTEGQVQIRGRIGSLLEVGTGFHPELTGRENIFLNGSILGMTRAEILKKFDEIATFAEIEKLLDTPVKRYSSGMYVRLAFAVAAHLDPEILLVDEVLAVGDVAFQKKCLGKMQEVTRAGRTVLLVSHNMSTVKQHCDQCLLLKDGRLAVLGDVEKVVGTYLQTVKDNSPEKIITDQEHLTGINRMRIKKIKLINPAANSFSVHWSQPIQIGVEFEVYSRIEQASFGAGIRTFDGIPVISVHHDDDGRPLLDLEPGAYQISFTLQNDLRPGFYKLGVGVHEKYVAKNICYLPEAADLEVLDFSAEGKIPIPYNAGLFNGRSEWTQPERLPDRG